MSNQLGLRGHRIKNQEQAKERRRAILVAAAQVFARAGYARATLDDVAAQLGVSRGVIYYYFRSKEDLLAELVATSSGEARERLEAIIARGDPPDVTLEAGLRDLASHLSTDLDRYATVVVGTGLDRDHRWMTATHSYRQRYRALIRGIIEDGIRAGVFVSLDPGLMALAVLKMVLGTGAWYRPEGEFPLDVIVDQTIEMAMRSVRRCH